MLVSEKVTLEFDISAIRNAGSSVTPAGENPWRPDPFTFFANYPTETLRPDMRFAPMAGATAEGASAVLKSFASNFAQHVLPTEAELVFVFALLKTKGPQTAAQLASGAPPHRRPTIERAALWLLKHGFVTLVNGKQTPPD